MATPHRDGHAPCRAPGRHPGSDVLLLLAVCIVLAGLTACGHTPQIDSRSGPDRYRDTSPELPLNTAVDDTCSAPDSDNVDWHHLWVRDQGTLNVAVRIDSRDMQGSIYLHDGFGRPMHRLRVTPVSDFYEFGALKLEPGRYYVRIVCEQGATLYTVAATFEAELQDAGVRYVSAGGESRTDSLPVPPPERVESQGKGREGTPGNRGSGRRGGASSSASSESSEPESTPATPRIVVGVITLVTPGENESMVTIRGVGTRTGVRSGAQGTIKDIGRTVHIVGCQESKCTGIVRASGAELTSYSTVEFRVESGGGS